MRAQGGAGTGQGWRDMMVLLLPAARWGLLLLALAGLTATALPAWLTDLRWVRFLDSRSSSS